MEVTFKVTVQTNQFECWQDLASQMQTAIESMPVGDIVIATVISGQD